MSTGFLAPRFSAVYSGLHLQLGSASNDLTEVHIAPKSMSNDYLLDAYHISRRLAANGGVEATGRSAGKAFNINKYRYVLKAGDALRTSLILSGMADSLMKSCRMCCSHQIYNGYCCITSSFELLACLPKEWRTESDEDSGDQVLDYAQWPPEDTLTSSLC